MLFNRALDRAALLLCTWRRAVIRDRPLGHFGTEGLALHGRPRRGGRDRDCGLVEDECGRPIKLVLVAVGVRDSYLTFWSSVLPASTVRLK